ncbi:CRISPR system Cascade subunit CasC [Actinopolyspora alba]|uniref:CRISPR system Cascade subunit CasC n=1 Tax=Actinopolyspora alba TaxID=673379 RepID=A0A1I2CIG6_9ACTN|nr:type I-E CRISPR-associated protein Cas7/Cse4/CasC [Actinopolyspora alba]SFE68137.1 CRISPR system Cascade subunit CasC [Actinopolyspora alba]
MHLDIHALQPVPYSNLNRDALGSPKSCVYGGSTRTRVSSQSWKRAVRFELEQQLDEPTVRTRRIPEAARKELEHRGWDHDTARKAGRAVLISADQAATRKDSKEGGLFPTPDDDQSDVLFWVPRAVITDLADLAEQYPDAIADMPLPSQQEVTKKERPKKQDKPQPVLPVATVEDILRRRSPSINLLGRMLAEIPGHRVDGASLFAHAFTTHESAMDFDFFTAVDDLNPPDATGSGHLATAEFTSGVFYRYSSVNLTDLASNLSGTDKTRDGFDDALRVVDAYLRAFCEAVPSGKQRTTGATTRPELVYLALRHDPLSLSGAFEKPVRSHSGSGYAEPSREQLANYTGRLHRFLGTDGLLWHGHASIAAEPYEQLGEGYDSLHDLITDSTNRAGDAA